MTVGVGVTSTTKRRILRVDHLKWNNWAYDANGNLIDRGGPAEQVVYSRQITTSEGHAWPKDRNVRDAGGPFDTTKLEYQNVDRATYRAGPWPFSVYSSYAEGNNFPYAYDIPSVFLVENDTDSNYQQWIGFSGESPLLTKGTQFIADTIPTNPILDASVSLAELYREGLPRIVGATLLKNKAGFFRSLGSEYLNYEFGWKPFVSDLKNAAKAVIQQDEVLRQLQRDSGRDVHRKRLLPEVVISTGTKTLTNYFPSGIQSDAFLSPSWYRTTDTVKRQYGFSGNYTFHFERQQMDEVDRIATEARVLYGLTLTPEVVWNLAPWSWLVDWVLNVGDLFHNISAFQEDKLVLRYGYVMEQNSRTFKRHNLRPPMKGPTDYPRASADVFRGIRKSRRKATPYGFGLLHTSFTTRQWAILGALGITRAPKSITF